MPARKKGAKKKIAARGKKKSAAKKAGQKAARKASRKAAKAAPRKPAPKKASARKPRAAPAAPPPAPVAAKPTAVVESPAPAAESAERAPEPPRPEPVNDTNVKPGDAAPTFELSADDDSVVRLGDLRGRKVVLYFYPRDNTPGCTIEARDFSQLQHEFESKNAIVLGVSTDDLNAHRKFKHTCDLTVKLLSDPGAAVHQAYGVWREKNMYGVKKMGTIRSTFLIDENGHIARVWPRVKVEDHALEVLNTL
jgi:peroxiredoxin Q/BCP